MMELEYAISYLIMIRLDSAATWLNERSWYDNLL